MLKYSKYPGFRKKTELLGGKNIAFDTICCQNVLPSHNLSDNIWSNEIFEVDLITEGSGICQIFGQSVPCKKGDAFVIPPDIPHGCFVSENGEKMSISRLLFDINDWFSPDVVDSGNTNFCYGTFCGGALIAYAALNTSVYEFVFHIFDCIVREIKERRMNRDSAIRSYLSVLFITLGRYSGEEVRVSDSPLGEWHNASVAVRMVMENFGDSTLKLEKLAETFHVSKSHFSRLFREFTGESFSDYLRNVRMNNACKLLRDTGMTVR